MDWWIGGFMECWSVGVNHPPCDFRFLLSQFRLFSTPARARAAETLKPERTLSDLINQAYGLTPAESAEIVICSFPICSGGSVNG
jgi:hypothetical protein